MAVRKAEVMQCGPNGRIKSDGNIGPLVYLTLLKYNDANGQEGFYIVSKLEGLYYGTLGKALQSVFEFRR